MKGGFVHNQILVAPIERYFNEVGAEVLLEHGVQCGAVTLFSDLVADFSGVRVVVEAELSAKRVVRDVEKALALKADLLLIVTPTSRVTKACRRQLVGVGLQGVEVCVLSFPLALREISNKFPLIVEANVKRK